MRSPRTTRRGLRTRSLLGHRSSGSVPSRPFPTHLARSTEAPHPFRLPALRRHLPPSLIALSPPHRSTKAFLPSLTSFLIALSPSLGKFSPILLALGVDSVDAIAELLMLEEAELARLTRMDRRGESGGEGSRSLMELPPLERAQLKSSLKERAGIDAGVARSIL